MNYKLICIDMDGTLLNEHSEVSERNKNALKKAVDAGIKVAISTGRIFASADYFSDLLGIKTEVITSNGAYIRDKSTDEVIYSSTLTKEQLLKIHNVIKGHNFKIMYSTYDTAIMDEDISETHSYKVTNKLVSDEKKKIKFFISSDINEIIHKYPDKIVKVICLDDREDKTELLKAKEEVLKFSDVETVSSGYGNFEVMQGGVSKGHAAKILGEKLGITREETICIGDNENDLAMIKYAGLGIAMGNGCTLAKEAADYITDTNVNDGVAKAIEKFAL